MAGTSELEVAQRAHDGGAAFDPRSAQSASVIMPLLAMAEVVGAAPEKVAELGAECLARVRAAAAELEQNGRSRFLPLLTELEQTLVLLAAPLGANPCAAVAAAMDLLGRALKCDEPPPRAREMIAIAELRSVRGMPAPWRSPVIECAAAVPEAARTAAEVSAEARAQILPRVLAAYRRSLLSFLRFNSSDEARRLSDLSLRVADAAGEQTERRRWLAAAALFACADESGGTARPLVKRLAVKLEQVLRHLSEEAPVNEPGGRALIADLEVLTALLRQSNGAAACDEDSAVTLKVDAKALASLLKSLLDTPEDPRERLAQISDAFLVEGKYDRWLEAHRLAARREGAQALETAVLRWESLLDDGESAPAPGASGHFAQARAALSRIEAALTPGEGSGNVPGRVSGVPVDVALLENLNLMAREIRGARSRAEANLGSLKGGLVDMDRSIRKLRLQLESLEVESQVHNDATRVEAGNKMPSRFGALSRGIEELAGLKDALQSLTEETESALAVQAGEDAQLEQGLLKTRLMPVGAQFEALCRCVRRAASERGLAATLSARGAEVALERSQADALTRALEPLLEACVQNGPATGVSPPPVAPVANRIELAVSQPGFDVRVDIAYQGTPLSAATLAESSSGMDTLGTVVAGPPDGEGRARVSVLIPGPPQPMDLLLVEVGKNRFALPLEDVSGVSRPADAGGAREGHAGFLKVEDEFYRRISLADVLELGTAHASGSVCVLVAQGGSLMALAVDAVIDRRRAVVRSPGPLLSSNPWVLGVVVDARVAPTLVLDLRALEIK
jgi:chemotaxis protein histidine kinase CheA